MGINLINASDGSGEAVLAVVNAARTAGSTTISVVSTTNWPANFIATAGTELSGGILSNPLVFSGHLSGANTIVIDTIAPGYVDAGSSVGDVVVIKPATMWADNIGTTLSTSLNDNGSIKNSVVDYANLLSTIFSGQVSTIANTGTAGGTMSYVNLGGIKILWGKTAVTTVNATTATVFGISLPSGFFSSIQGGGISASNFSGTYNITTGFQTNQPTISTADIAVNNSSNVTASLVTYYILIGT